MSQKDYGVEEYVPEEGRHYSFWDMAAVWMGANCHPSTWWIGGIIAAVGFAGALKINIIASPLAALFVALVGFIGYRVGTTTIGLARIPFGIRGSVIPGILNAITCIGWAAISNYLAAITISYILGGLFGTPVYGEPGSFWILIGGATLNGVLSLMLVLVGGSRSIAIAEKVLVAGLILMSGWITVVVFRTYDLAQIMAWVPEASIRLPFGTAFDYLFAFQVTWAVSCAEFTRYAKTKAAATLAPGLGLSMAAWWFVIVGTLGTIAVAISSGLYDPNMSDPSSLAIGLGLGWLAFFVIIASTVTTNLVGIYVGGYSIMAVTDKVSLKSVMRFIGMACIVVSWVPIIYGSFYNVFSTFLGYIGAVFPTLVAIMIVDYYFIRKGNYKISEIGNRKGPYWYKNGFNWYAMIVWLVSSILVFILQQRGFGANYLGAVLPGIFIAGFLYYIVATILLKRGYFVDMEVDQEKGISMV